MISLKNLSKSLLGGAAQADAGHGPGGQDAVAAAARAALANVIDPGSGADLVTAGLVGHVSAAPGDAGAAVTVVLEAPADKGAALASAAAQAEREIAALAGVASAQVVITAEATAQSKVAQSRAAQSDAATGRADPGPAPQLKSPAAGRAPHAPGPGETPLRPPPKREGPIPGVDRIIAIGSGKGGVGKSTVSANLACALALEGRRIGLLDADVYGPSQPRMLGLSGRPASPDGKIIEPLRGHGVTVMSIGFMTEEDKAVIWRGPMLMSALQQMLRQVAWGELDALLVDLPPGTGDVQLTLSQKAEVDGAIVVSTPQDIALLDARKAIDMFERTQTPVIGIIENMATFCCPNCGHETELFGRGGAKAEAARIGAPFLGEIPLDIDIRLAGDGGAPVVVAKPESPQAERFRDIARGLVHAGAA